MNKRQLYENIMMNVAKEVKKALNESADFDDEWRDEDEDDKEEYFPSHNKTVAVPAKKQYPEIVSIPKNKILLIDTLDIIKNLSSYKEQLQGFFDGEYCYLTTCLTKDKNALVCVFTKNIKYTLYSAIEHAAYIPRIIDGRLNIKLPYSDQAVKEYFEKSEFPVALINKNTKYKWLDKKSCVVLTTKDRESLFTDLGFEVISIK